MAGLRRKGRRERCELEEGAAVENVTTAHLRAPSLVSLLITSIHPAAVHFQTNVCRVCRAAIAAPPSARRRGRVRDRAVPPRRQKERKELHAITPLRRKKLINLIIVTERDPTVPKGAEALYPSRE